MIKSERKSGLAVKIQLGTHELVADVMPDLGGQDEGPDPHRLLEAALGACTTITVQMYANRKGWKLDSCDAVVRFTQEDEKAIVIERLITFRGELDAGQKARLLEIADKCPIHRVLTRGVKVESRLV
jgi:putative redox protein